MAKKPRTPRRPRDLPKHILDIALGLAAEHGWRRLTMGRIAGSANVSLSELYVHYPSKGALLAAFLARTDAATAPDRAGPVDGEGVVEDSARDRLFEVIMRRLDALNPHKDAVRAILRDARCDPITLCAGHAPVRRSLMWMLECAGLNSTGLVGAMRTEGLAVIYLATLRVWLRDESPDMERTMAALDRQLMRAETIMRAFCPWRGRRRAPDLAA